jgi:protein-S-isoprenylcysteine O-methyltransferase Ste14
VALLTALLMWCVSRYASTIGVATTVRVVVAFTFAAVGMAFDVSGLIAFHRAKTTVNPMKPGAASSLVDSGVYRMTRNPMYVGLVFLLLGWAAYLGSPWTLAGPFVFAAYINRFQIAPEEQALAALFGEAYLAYRARVRRWL